MKIFIEVHHPAHIHFFKNAVKIWLARGDRVFIAGRERGIMQQLAGAVGLSVRAITRHRYGIVGSVMEFTLRQIKVAKEISSFKPDVVLSLMGVYTQTARILGVPSIIFTDSDFQHVAHRIAHPFASLICTPTCFKKNLGKKQMRYAGYHELAYLHPNRFSPDPAVLSEAGLSPGEDFFVVRFISWDTLHDVGQKGFRGTEKLELLRLLSEKGPVFVSSEGSMPPEFYPYRMPVGPEKIHHLLYFARMYVGEGATLASEAAVLGTPSVFVNTLPRSYVEELENSYGLAFCYRDGASVLRKVEEILRIDDRDIWRRRRVRMLADKIDVTAFVIGLVDDFLRGKCLAGQ